MNDYLDTTLKHYQKTADEYAAKRANSETDSVELLEKFTELVPDKEVLEIGFGLGYDARWLIEHGFIYTGVDPVQAFANRMQKKQPQAKVVNVDIRELNLPENSITNVWAMASLLHLNDQDVQDLIKRIHQWMKEGGIFCATVKEGEGEFNSDDGRYFNFFTKEKFLTFTKDIFELVDFQTAPPKSYNKTPKNWLTFYLKKI